MIKIVVASNNKNKISEIKNILGSENFNVVSLDEEGIVSNPIENGITFEENSFIKAENAKQFTKEIVIADDSGLEVIALNNEPGVYSARYAKENATDRDNNELLISNIKKINKENREAKFVTCITAIFEDNTSKSIFGQCEGSIITVPQGVNGFGYDPIFFVEKFKKTFAQLTNEEKNLISHRGKAIRALKEILETRYL